MIIVGELINASRKAIREMIETENAEGVTRVAQDQKKRGADYIDVNAGVFVEREMEYLRWLVTIVQSETALPCCLDSPNPKAIETALAVHKGTPMINSISLEKERFDNLVPVISGVNCKVVALCMSDEGMPETADERLSIADRLINNLTANNIAIGNIYVDPLVQPVSTNNSFGLEFLKAIEGITRNFPGVHTMCGLSNISYGLPERKLVNQAFMIMAINRGLDAAIVNPQDKRMMASIKIAEMLVGRDDYCMSFLSAFRNGQLAI
jgi:cobalamin-dependent methionine synthase I